MRRRQDRYPGARQKPSRFQRVVLRDIGDIVMADRGHLHQQRRLGRRAEARDRTFLRSPVAQHRSEPPHLGFDFMAPVLQVGVIVEDRALLGGEKRLRGRRHRAWSRLPAENADRSALHRIDADILD